MSGSRFVVLGATGFVGAAVATEAARQGNEVVRLGSNSLNLLSQRASDDLASLLDERTILFVAIRARVGDDRWAIFRDDAVMVASVARAVARRRVRKCALFSSVAVYGDALSNDRLVEETPLSPQSLYATSRVMAEAALRDGAAESASPLLVLRLGMVYGPGDTSIAYGPATLMASAVNEGRVSIFGDGSERRPYIFIDDLARVTIAMAVGSFKGEFNVADGRSRSFADIVQDLRTIIGRDLDVVVRPRLRPLVDLAVDPARLRAALPGLAFTDFRAGLTEAYRILTRDRGVAYCG